MDYFPRQKFHEGFDSSLNELPHLQSNYSIICTPAKGKDGVIVVGKRSGAKRKVSFCGLSH